MDGTDPGWPPARTIAAAFLFVFQSKRMVDRAPNPLLGIRALFVQFVVSLVLFGVLAFLAGGQGASIDAGVVAVVILVVGIASLGARHAFERSLDCRSDATLASTYRTRFFLRVAFAQVPALVGFVGFFQAGDELWAYGLGCAFAAVGFMYAAPTKGQIARDQQALQLPGPAVRGSRPKETL